MQKDQVKTGAVLSYLELFLGVLISLIIHPIIINKIGISENGIFHMAINVVSSLNLLNLGLGSTFIRFYTKYKVNNDKEGEEKLNGLFLFMYIIIALVMALCGIAIIFLADKIFPEFTANEIVVFKQVITILLIQSCLSLIASVFTMNINAREKFIFAKVVGIVNAILLAVGKVVIVLYGYKALGLAIMTITFAMVTIIVEGIYALGVLKVRFKFGKIEKSLVKSIFAFSFFIFLNQIIDLINWQVDSIILGIVAGTSAVAIYSMATIFNGYVRSFSTALSSVLVPRVNRLIIGGTTKDQINRIFIKTGRIQFIVLACVILIYVFFGKAFIVNFFANPEYLETYYIGLLLIVPLIIPLIQDIGVEIQRAYNKHQFRSIAYTIMALINLAMSIPLGIYYGGIGCAIGTCISLLVGNGLIMNIYYYKKLDIDIKSFWKSILGFIPALVWPSLYGALIMVYADLSNFWLFLLSVFGFVIVYVISMFIFGLSKGEQIKLIERIRRKFKGKKNENKEESKQINQ